MIKIRKWNYIKMLIKNILDSKDYTIQNKIDLIKSYLDLYECSHKND